MYDVSCGKILTVLQMKSDRQCQNAPHKGHSRPLASGQLPIARAYLVEDGNLLASFGAASGYLPVLVLALYISTDHVSRSYGRYEFIWLFCILQLY